MRTESQNTKRCLSHSTLNAISHCTEPCSRTLEKFNKLSDEIIACLSILHSSRIVYTVSILLRLRYFIFFTPQLVEKEFIPRHAVFSILTLKRRLLGDLGNVQIQLFFEEYVVDLAANHQHLRVSDWRVALEGRCLDGVATCNFKE